MKKSRKFLDFCKKHNINPDAVPDIMTIPAAFKARKIELKKISIADIPKRFHKWLITAFKLAVFIEAINTDENGKLWQPDYKDSNQLKYEIWWKIKADKNKPSGFGLSYYGYDSWSTFSDVPARLCLRSNDCAKFVGKLLPDIFTDFQLITK
jgi:hypothetical protein